MRPGLGQPYLIGKFLPCFSELPYLWNLMRTHCLLTPPLLLLNLEFLGRDTGTSGAALGGQGSVLGGQVCTGGARSVLGGRSVLGAWVCAGGQVCAGGLGLCWGVTGSVWGLCCSGGNKKILMLALKAVSEKGEPGGVVRDLKAAPGRSWAPRSLQG